MTASAKNASLPQTKGYSSL